MSKEAGKKIKEILKQVCSTNPDVEGPEEPNRRDGKFAEKEHNRSRGESDIAKRKTRTAFKDENSAEADRSEREADSETEGNAGGKEKRNSSLRGDSGEENGRDRIPCENPEKLQGEASRRCRDLQNKAVTCEMNNYMVARRETKFLETLYCKLQKAFLEKLNEIFIKFAPNSMFVYASFMTKNFSPSGNHSHFNVLIKL